ncbi:hypothetical protein CU097_005351 [Rhizopus azygosporus]|uniref:Cyclin-like domain-containing protein n=1 Tax=Rhizopus azygosporus TaxID=86630 RepID=A0A367J9N1_RHIAZ|nr:hypothetical protein CU097_005351 [Rhizopus azygosporus]
MSSKKKCPKRKSYEKQDAATFLSNISLGSENDLYPNNALQSTLNDRPTSFHEQRKMHSSSSNSSITSNSTNISNQSSSSNQSTGAALYKLTDDDNQRLIASEKVKRKPDPFRHKPDSGRRFVSLFRYYQGVVKQSTRKTNHRFHYSYVHEHIINRHLKHQKAISYSHFLASNETPTKSYTPYFLDFDENNILLSFSSTQDSLHKLKHELNENFRLSHPEVIPELTFSKIKSIKLHLQNITKNLDLELSTLSHAYVYVEKLIQKNVVTKQNRKLVAACCLYLAVKINEPKGVCFHDLFEAISGEIGIGSKDIRGHEFAVFADLEFSLYVPIEEFMPHLDKLVEAFGYQSIKDYVGDELFYEIKV